MDGDRLWMIDTALDFIEAHLEDDIALEAVAQAAQRLSLSSCPLPITPAIPPQPSSAG